MTTSEVWMVVGAMSLALFVGVVVLAWRMPLYRWYCRRCKKIVSMSRFHPDKCGCGATALVANFCKQCGSWNTTSAPSWHCNACSSKNVTLGAEYMFYRKLWRWHNQVARGAG